MLATVFETQTGAYFLIVILPLTVFLVILGIVRSRF